MLSGERILARNRGSYHGEIQVVEQARTRFMRFGSSGGWQGAVDLSRPDVPVFPYQRAFNALVSSLPSVQRFLAFGVGTGTALRTVERDWPDCELYAVDIDESVLKLAIDYFNSPKSDRVHYYAEDGISWLSSNVLKFDLIFVDAYLTNAIYSPCLDPSFVEILRYSLQKSGVVALNLIGKVPVEGRIEAFLRTAQQHFATIQILPVGIPFSEQNMLAVCFQDDTQVAFWRQSMERHPHLNRLQHIMWPFRLRAL